MTLVFPLAFSGSLSSPSSPRSASASSRAASASSAASSNSARDETARHLAQRLHRIEGLGESLLAEGGALVGDRVDARRTLGLATVVGRPAFEAVLQALDATGAPADPNERRRF